MASATAKANRNGSMEAVTKDSGRTGKLMAAESSTTLMEISTREIGSRTKPMETVPTRTQMELSTSARGRTTSNTALVLKHGPTEPSTRVNTMRERRMVGVSLPSQMDQYTKENSK